MRDGSRRPGSRGLGRPRAGRWLGLVARSSPLPSLHRRPAAELYVIIKVAARSASPPTIALLLSTASWGRPPALAGPRGVEPASTRRWRRAGSRPGGLRRGGGDLRRRPPIHARVHHRHVRPLLLIPPTRDLVRRAAMALGAAPRAFGPSAAGAAGGGIPQALRTCPGPGAAPRVPTPAAPTTSRAPRPRSASPASCRKRAVRRVAERLRLEIGQGAAVEWDLRELMRAADTADPQAAPPGG